MTYPKAVSCGTEGCAWLHEAEDEDDGVLAWQNHVSGGACPQRPASVPEQQQEAPAADIGPDDPVLTVRAGDGVLAVRAPASSLNPEADPDQLAWFIVSGGGGLDLPDLEIPELVARVTSWPIVYQP
jgi:hypothetical protein